MKNEHELPHIMKHSKIDTFTNFKKVTMDEKSLKKKVLMAPVTPHQNGTFDNRQPKPRKEVFSGNQIYRKFKQLEDRF